MVSVYVVEDDLLLARHVRSVLEQTAHIAFAGHADRIAVARDEIPRCRPTVVLSDLSLPDGHGTTLIEELKATSHGAVPHILVFSVFGEESHVLKAIEAGADGYLLKGCSPSELVTAIEQAARGESPISPSIARHLLKRFRPHGPSVSGGGAEADPVVDSPLTAREVEVLQLVAKGYVTEEIAQRMHISANTVSSHIRNLYGKLQVGKRAQAVSEAQKRGWLT